MKQVNNVVKTVPKAKKQGNKPSFYIVLGLIIFCIIGSMLGTLSFFKVHAEDIPEYNVVEYSNLLDSSNLNNYNGTETYFNGVYITFDTSSEVFRVTGTVGSNSGYTYIGISSNVPAISNTVYSCYFYSNFTTGVIYYSNQLNGGHFQASSNQFYTANTDEHDFIKFYLALDNSVLFGETLDFEFFVMLWQGDWELSEDIKSSVSYQIGYRTGSLETANMLKDKGLFGSANSQFYLEFTVYGNGIGNDYVYYSILPSSYLDFGYSSFNANVNRLGTYILSQIPQNIDTSIYTSISVNIFCNFVGYVNVNEHNYYTLTTGRFNNGIDLGFGFSSILTDSYFTNQHTSSDLNTIINTMPSWDSDNLPTFNYTLSENITFDYTQYNFIRLSTLPMSFSTLYSNPTYFVNQGYFKYGEVAELGYALDLIDSWSNSSYDNGYNKGRVDGISLGKSLGYDSGYSAGLSAGGNYTFFSLMSSVLDAPIQAFSGLFNFNIFGINFLSIFTFLITLAIVIKILSLLK